MKSRDVATIQEYFRCFKDRDRGTLERILTADLTHVSPFSSYDSRDQMLDEIWPHVGKTWATDIQVFDNSSEYLVYYRHEGASDATMIERFTFAGEQIQGEPGRGAREI